MKSKNKKQNGCIEISLFTGEIFVYVLVVLAYLTYGFLVKELRTPELLLFSFYSFIAAPACFCIVKAVVGFCLSQIDENKEGKRTAFTRLLFGIALLFIRATLKRYIGL